MDRAEVIRRIEQVLNSEVTAIEMSEALFSPGGLFSRLGDTEAARREVSRLPLYRRAQARLTELQRAEGARFAGAIREVRAAVPEGRELTFTATKAA